MRALNLINDCVIAVISVLTRAVLRLTFQTRRRYDLHICIYASFESRVGKRSSRACRNSSKGFPVDIACRAFVKNCRKLFIACRNSSCNTKNSLHVLWIGVHRYLVIQRVSLPRRGFIADYFSHKR